LVFVTGEKFLQRKKKGVGDIRRRGYNDGLHFKKKTTWESKSRGGGENQGRGHTFLTLKPQERKSKAGQKTR